jgi:hypothetical protein
LQKITAPLVPWTPAEQPQLQVLQAAQTQQQPANKMAAAAAVDIRLH